MLRQSTDKELVNELRRRNQIIPFHDNKFSFLWRKQFILNEIGLFNEPEQPLDEKTFGLNENLNLCVQMNLYCPEYITSINSIDVIDLLDIINELNIQYNQNIDEYDNIDKNLWEYWNFNIDYKKNFRKLMFKIKCNYLMQMRTINNNLSKFFKIPFIHLYVVTILTLINRLII